MKSFIRLLLLLVPFATFAQSHPLHAQAPASPEIREVAEKYLVGSWSSDPATCNQETVWYWGDGKLLGQFLHAGVLINRLEVDLEKIKVLNSDPHRMVWSMEIKSLTVQSGQTSFIRTIVEGRNGGERRILQSVRDGQHTLIKDGVFSNGGTPTPRIVRCQQSVKPAQLAAVQSTSLANAPSVAAQSSLPPCPVSGYKHNCFGTETYTNGNRYVGEFKDGKRHGQGTNTFADGNEYVGEYIDDKRNGQGTFTWANGEKYVGEFRDDKTNGRGTRTFANRSIYVGEEKDGLKHGQGTITYPDGRKYVGEWRDDKRNGQGIEYRADGTIIRSGQWAFGDLVQSFALDRSRFPFNAPTQTASVRPNGTPPPCPSSSRWDNCFGSRTFNNGNNYVGEFKDDKHHGQGTYTWANGDKYVGEWRDGTRNGQGTLTSANGHKYVGEYKDDRFLGQGTYTWANGDKYVGEFKDNMFHGQGIEYRADGTIIRLGQWAFGRLVQSFALDRSRFPFNAPTQTASVRPNSTPVTPNAEPIRSTLNLAVIASPPDSNGVLTLNITTNSDTASLRVNGDEVGGRVDGRYSVNRFAQIGDNNFEVIATDRFGNTQRQTISVSRRAADNTVRFASLNPISVRARPATNAVAIIIGIQDYRRVSKAEFASNDARVFYDYAVRGLGVRPENIKLLVDQQADAIEILSAFNNWLPLKTRKGQTDVYVFFSGHGLPSDDGSNLYMLPYGVDRQFLDRTAIKQSELIASLQAVSPRSVTMFMDACYSGQSRTGETLLASARPISIQAKASSFPSNFNVISASAPDQLASSSPDLKHGIFSYYLMKGMEGEADENRDGNITMAEMQSYLKEYVGKKAMSLSRTQVPQVTGDQSRVLVSK